MSSSHQPHEKAGPGLRLRLEAASACGCATRCLDPETGYLFEISRGERRRVLYGGLSPLNDAVATAVASDKFHCATVLSNAGHKVPVNARCVRPGRFAAGDFASHTGLPELRGLLDTVGLPAIVKPGHGARGRGVTAAETEADLVTAIEHIWQDDHLAVIEAAAVGIDLRIDMLDGACLIAYLRRHLNVVADGRRTFSELVAAAGGDPEAARADPTWREEVATRGLGGASVPAAGTRLSFTSPVLNLNRLATAELIEPLPDAWLAYARQIGRTLRLRHFGLDLKITDLASVPSSATVIEVNASPSMEQIALRGHHAQALAGEVAVVEAIMAADFSADSSPGCAGGSG